MMTRMVSCQVSVRQKNSGDSSSCSVGFRCAADLEGKGKGKGKQKQQKAAAKANARDDAPL
jgi:hypothetical protein